MVNARSILIPRICLALGLLVGCGSENDTSSLDPDGGGGGASTEPDGSRAGDGPVGSDGGVAYDADGSVVRSMRISPAEVTLEASGAPTTAQFEALIGDERVSTVTFTVDDPRLGSFGPDGVFTSNGKIAGTTQVTARFGSLSATATLHVTVDMTSRADGVSDDQVSALDAGGSSDAQFSMLYPYEGTVWPRGIKSPSLQWAGQPADAVRIAIQVGDFSYVGYFAGANLSTLDLPQDVWDALTQSSDGTTEVEVTLSKLRGGAVTGPLAQHWRVAPGDMKGIIYYNTYKSASTSTGAVMRIRPGADAEVMLTGCTVCHSVSAQGNVLIAGKGWGDSNPIDSVSYDLLEDGSTAPRATDQEGRKLPFGALSPDGTYVVGNAFVGGNLAVRGAAGPFESKVYESATGSAIDVPTWPGSVKYAITPAFAPDGSRLAFNWGDQNAGRTLAVMTTDLQKSPPVFGAPEPVVQVSTGIPGWPSFLPDGQALLFHQGDRFDTAGYGFIPAYADLRLVDIATSTVNPLNALNGYREDGTTSYLPYGADEEGRRNYEPSVLPVPVGGYYWVIFTSRRAYGNTLAPNGSVAGSDNEWGVMLTGDVEQPSLRKKLWIAAIDVNYMDKVDPSHPAFYLPGQELLAGNMRAYAAFEPCHAEGMGCVSGADCCTGFCRLPELYDDDHPPEFTCVPPPADCARIDETCSTSADCCGAEDGVSCINRHCAIPTPILR